MAVFAPTDLKKWRESQGIHPHDLAEAVSCDITTIYRYESGKLKPNPDVMYQICEFLGDVTKWEDWMRTEYPTSYGRVHPETLSYGIQGALMSLFAEMSDVANLQIGVLRDAADGSIDSPQLADELNKEVAEMIQAAQRVKDILQVTKRG